MNRFIKDLLSVGFSKILMILFGLASSVIVARTLGPEINGVIATLLVYPSLFMSFGSLGIRQSTTYFLGKGIYSEDQIKKAISQIWLLSSSFSIIICYLLIRFASNSGNSMWLIILAVLPIPFSLFNTYNSGIFLGKNQINNFNKINWIPTLISFLIVIILVLWLDFGINGYLLALFGGPCFISIVLLYKTNFSKFFSFKYNFEVIKKMLGLGLIYALALLVNNLNYRIDIVFLDKISTTYQTGIYSKGIALSEYLWQIPAVLYTLIFARSAISTSDNGFSLKVCQLLRLVFVVIVFCAIILYIFAEFIVVSLFGVEFYDSVYIFRIILPGAVVFVFFGVLNMDLSGKGKPWASLKAMFPALIVNVILNLLLIPEHGANGAALASTISYSISGILFLFIYSKETQITVLDIILFKRSDFRVISQLRKKRNVRNESIR